MTCFFTVCDRKQLPEALALGESIRANHSDARFVIGLADRLNLSNTIGKTEIITADQLKISALAEMSNRYYDFEFVHAVRPWFARHLIEQSSPEIDLVFLAPTTQLYQPIDNVLALSGDFLLSPNITQRLPESANLDDKRILNIGMFHSNAWVARKTPDVVKMLDWWCERTIDRAFFDLCNGMCLDQLWLNYAPIHVKNWRLIRNPIWHVGLHNALLHPVKMVNDTQMVGNDRVLTIDFAGIQGFHPVWSDHSQIISDNHGWSVLIRNYREMIKKNRSPAYTGLSGYGKPAPISPARNFRKSVKSELDQIIRLIDKIEL